MRIRTIFNVIAVVFSLFCIVNGSDPYSSPGPSLNLFSFLRSVATEAGKVFGYLGEVLSAAVEEDCIFKCPNGAKPKHNIYYKPVSNGCGVPSIQIPSFIPEQVKQIITKCCDDHDICYGTCMKDKEKCDKKFKRCLYDICSTFKNIVYDKNFDKGCKTVAKTFYMTVLGGGCKYYLDAQKEACICDVNYYQNEL